MESQQSAEASGNDEITSEVISDHSQERDGERDIVENAKLDADHDLALLLNEKVDRKMTKQRMMYKHIHNRLSKSHKMRAQKRKQQKLSRKKNRS